MFKTLKELALRSLGNKLAKVSSDEQVGTAAEVAALAVLISIRDNATATSRADQSCASEKHFEEAQELIEDARDWLIKRRSGWLPEKAVT